MARNHIKAHNKRKGSNKATGRDYLTRLMYDIIYIMKYKYPVSRLKGLLQSQNGELNPNYKHGMHGTRVYHSWRSMLSRCENPKATGYHNYGGRGIKVCDEWHDFVRFYKDMGDRPDGTTLDRIDVNGDYYKENCRWVDPKTQSDNQRYCSGKVPHRGIDIYNNKYRVTHRRKHLGYFTDLDKAISAWESAEKEYQDGKK